MKVLFLTVGRESPSAKWRILQFIPYFQKAGVECSVEEWPSGTLARLSLAGRVGVHDIVVLQKRLMPKLIVNRLRKNARALVFEFDDLVTLKKTEEGTINESPTRERRFRRVVRLADAVVTSNDTLAELARRVAEDPEKVHVHPTVIDLARWEPRGPSDAGAPVTVGWMGTASNLPSVQLLAPPLARLTRRHEGLRIKIVCDEPLTLEGVALEQKKFDGDQEVADVRSFDIAVAPLVEDPWTRGKLSTKILAYFAAGLPVVASDVTANRLYVKDGENGYLVGTLGKWEERLAKLIEEPELRRILGAAARESVEKEYSIASAVPRYLGLFEKLAALPRK